MCEFETFGGGCSGCPYENCSLVCKKGRIEVHRLFVYGPEEESKYDRGVKRKRKMVLKGLETGGVR
jgi:hypothetical protein